MNNAAELLTILKDWDIIVIDIKHIQEQLNEKEYRITPNYADTGSASGGIVSSKVENIALVRLQLKQKIDKKQAMLNRCIEAYRMAELTEVEKKTIRYTCKRKSLIPIATEYGISNIKIYRIRLAAVDKMFNYIQNNSKWSKNVIIT